MLDEFPSTNPLYLGQVRISIDQEQFLDAIGSSMITRGGHDAIGRTACH